LDNDEPSPVSFDDFGSLAVPIKIGSSS
jgi:hypothetical protein